MAKLYKFFRLPVREKLLFFHALYLLAFYRIRLQRSSIQKLFDHVQHLSSLQHNTALNPVPPACIARLLNVAAELIPFSTCLSKAMAGQILLAKCGHKSKLHLGVSRDNQQIFAAHAWLSLDGTIILGGRPDLAQYRELPLHC